MPGLNKGVGMAKVIMVYSKELMEFMPVGSNYRRCKKNNEWRVIMISEAE